MIHSTLRDQDWSFCCQVNGNIKLSKFFDEMRLFRSLRLLRSLRPLRSLRLLRFKMLGKSLNMKSASCHFPLKRHKWAKNIEKKIENIFTLGTFKLFLAKKNSHPFSWRLWRTGMLLMTKLKDHRSNFHYSEFPNHLLTKSNLHISICQSQIH